MTGYVAFGSEVVPETATIEPFYAPGGGLEFFTFGHEPVLIEILSRGRYMVVDRDGFGQKLTAQVPLVETVPGAQDASVEKINVKVGSAIRVKGRTIFYGMLPTSCPKDGFTVKSVLTFAGLGGLAQSAVTVDLQSSLPEALAKPQIASSSSRRALDIATRSPRKRTPSASSRRRWRSPWQASRRRGPPCATAGLARWCGSGRGPPAVALPARHRHRCGRSPGGSP